MPCRQGPVFEHLKTLSAVNAKRAYKRAWAALNFSAKYLAQGFAANVSKTYPNDPFILEDIGVIAGGFEASSQYPTLGQIDHVDVSPPECFAIGLMNDASLTRVRSPFTPLHYSPDMILNVTYTSSCHCISLLLSASPPR